MILFICTQKLMHKLHLANHRETDHMNKYSFYSAKALCMTDSQVL